jgi:hypothetical protein
MEQDDGDGGNPNHQAVDADADADPGLENQETSQVCLFFPFFLPVLLPFLQ